MPRRRKSLYRKSYVEALMRDKYWLSSGAHATPEEGRCALEWVCYLAGEPHSDQPVCVSPVLRGFCTAFNDHLPDDERQKLRPYLARTIGTVGDGRDPERLAMCREHLVKTALPRLLDAAGRTAAAQRLRELPDPLTAENSRRVVAEVREEAYEARSEARARLRAKQGSSAAAAAAFNAAAAAAAASAAYADPDIASAAYAAAAITAAAGAYATSSMTYDEVYAKAHAAADEALRPLADQARRDGFELLDRMLPTEVVQVPVAADADAVCALR